jgi:hypothetical protein
MEENNTLLLEHAHDRFKRDGRILIPESTPEV